MGYVGKDVDAIIRDLTEIGVKQVREAEMKKVESRAMDAAEERVLDVLLPPPRGGGFGGGGEGAAPQVPDSSTRQKFRKRLREGELDDKEIELELAAPMPDLPIAGPAGMEELTQQLQGMFQGMGGRRKTRKLTIREAMKVLRDEEAGKLVNDDEVKLRALANNLV